MFTRLIPDPGNHANPVWTPDGRRIVFGSTPANQGTLNLYWRRADGVGDAQRLTDSPYGHVPVSMHPSGKSLAFSELNAQTNFDLLILPMEGDENSGWKPGKPTVFLKSRFDERNPMFSPDGRWIAYQSNESGRDATVPRTGRQVADFDRRRHLSDVVADGARALLRDFHSTNHDDVI